MTKLTLVLLVLALVLASSTLLSAAPIYTCTVEWSDLPIVGEDPALLPEGVAEFVVDNGELTLKLTNNTSQTLTAIGQALSGLTWDITDEGVSLIPRSTKGAVIAKGSGLVGYMSEEYPKVKDLSSEWAFRSDINIEGFGSSGIGAMGDVNDVETFGPFDRFNTEDNLFGPASPDGIDAAIVGPNVGYTEDGFRNNGPVVQKKMIFTFDISGAWSETTRIENVQPLFGTDGMPTGDGVIIPEPIPEPSTILLLVTGLTCIGAYGFRRRKKA